MEVVFTVDVPGFAGGGFHLVDPGFVDLDWVGVDAEVAVLNDARDQRV